MLRRIASILLTAAFALVFAACTTTETPNAEVTTEAGVATVESAGEATVETDADTTPTTEAEEDTGVITDTQEMTGTDSMTGTQEITGTQGMTDTGTMTDTQEMTDTEEITGTQGITGTGSTSGMGTVNLASSTNMGSYLVDAEGQTLYTFDGEDEAGIDTTMWLPVEAGDSDVVGAGLDDSLLGTTDREDGTQQVTYNDRPLYRFIGDLLPGDILGQGQDEAWWMVNAEGEIVTDSN